MLPANEERENSTVVNHTEAYIVAEVWIFDLSHGVVLSNLWSCFCLLSILPTGSFRRCLFVSGTCCHAFVFFLIQITKELIKRGIAGDDIGIISPYNSQVNIIRQNLDVSIEVQTIDKYQVIPGIKILACVAAVLSHSLIDPFLPTHHHHHTHTSSQGFVKEMGAHSFFLLLDRIVTCLS